MNSGQSHHPKFTPEVWARLPDRGPAHPNYDGTLILCHVWEYKIGGEVSRSIQVTNIESGELWTFPLSEHVFESTWLDSDTVIFLEKRGRSTGVFVVKVGASLRQVVGTMGGPVRNLKVQPLKDGSIALAVTGLVDASSGLVGGNPDKAGQVMVYDTYRVQESSSWLGPERMTIICTTLVKREGKWCTASVLQSAIPRACLPLSCDDYDISQEGVTFTSKEESRPFNSHVYFVRLASFAKFVTHEPERIDIQDDYPNSCSYGPRFSHDGSQIVFLLSPGDPSQKIQIYIYRIGAPKAINIFDMENCKDWPLYPYDVEFSPNDQALHLLAEDHGRARLYELSLHQPKEHPRELLCNGNVELFAPLRRNGSENLLLVTTSSFVDNSLYLVVDTNGDSKPSVLSSLTDHGARLGISQKQVSEIYFQGAGDYPVHAWMMKPSCFDENRKYPIVLFIHGGPRYSWRDRWEEEHNFLLWAEQGYIVVAPNITGSTGYGIDFENAIWDNWGGRPYDDLVKCMEHLERIPNVDVDNAVLLGDSFGGYLVNWIQGNPLGRRFKAMISIAGIFDLPTYVLQADYPTTDKVFGGKPLKWENMEGLEKYNPARQDLLPNWKTPMLVVHGGMDFRCPVVSGIAAFHTLQELGTPSRLVIFPHEGHGICGRDNLLELYRQSIAWANKYTAITDDLAITDESITTEESDAPDVSSTSDLSHDTD